MNLQQPHAEMLVKEDLLRRIFDKMERDALQQIIAAPLADDEARRNLSGEVRAIQSVRRKLSQIASGHVTLPDDTEA
jgi:hypothetical protein